MGLDPTHYKTAHEGSGGGQGSAEVTPAEPQSVFASTASMQSLLQSYFEEMQITPQPAANSNAPKPAAPASTVKITPPAPKPAAAPVKSDRENPSREHWPDEAKRLIETLTRQNRDLKAGVKILQERLAQTENLANSDVLTPTLNRRAFLREVHRAMADCRRYDQQACLVFLDLDGFKFINDTYGHAAGDQALIHVADLLLANTREGDSIGRLGGDEFAILLRHADLASAKVKAMKLEAELNIATFPHKNLFLKVGGSFGVRAFSGQKTAEAWVSEADAAMFLMKKSSR
ncbi:GGDEF domain-containing protein [Asticcacaulis sp. ZE23SCel15]|uniref:GGDEF domain-containing protein n=1 Tax=Asticcacaulis sp. ZE23SCel15 TaxID=3059027 RepID=UPI0026601DF4|nr:GGDEF domain-containing protein [Asticcacaulis sp. ZE23SCel15]WKL57517.1 GGDEF domain-containing protein [Asticcacaulis sp. ZE23SCel15]